MALLPHEKEITTLQETLANLRRQSESKKIFSSQELVHMEAKVATLQQQVYGNLSPWERVSICRHPKRPQSSDYIANIVDDFFEIFGDRTLQDDSAILTGFGTIGGERFVIVAQEKGKDTDSRLRRNFGMPHPAGYRKALRAMRLAEKFGLPVLALLDTPGAFPGLAAEEQGQGWVIAENLWAMARLKTPIIVVVIGEGCSGGALGIGVGDTIAMFQHAYYSVISPEGCASILWKDSSKNVQAAKILKMHVEDLLELGIVDHALAEPLGGGHLDPEQMYQTLKNFISSKVGQLCETPLEELLEMRYQKFRRMGKYETSSFSCSSK